MNDGTMRTWALRGLVCLVALLCGCSGGGGNNGGLTDEEIASVGTTDLLRLSAVQIRNVLLRLVPPSLHDEFLTEVPLPEAKNIEGFSTFLVANAPSGSNVAEIEAMAFSMAELMRAHPQTFLSHMHPCFSSDADDAEATSCANAFVRDVGKQLFRRPMEEGDVERYLDYFEATESGANAIDSLFSVFDAMLQSPRFLYRIEDDGTPLSSSPEVEKLSGYAVAARLSLLLHNNGPDAQLLEAAETGLLDTSDGVLAEAERLMDAPAFHVMVGEFLAEWMGTFRIDRDRVREAELTDEGGAALLDEVQRFVSSIAAREELSMRGVFSEERLQVPDALASIYGEAGPEVRPQERHGVLSLASVVTAHSKSGDDFAINRGHFLRKVVFCLPTPEFPGDLDVSGEAPPQSSATERDRAMPLLESPTCGGCHRSFHPAGFSLSKFDRYGVFRSEEGGQAIETHGTLPAIGTEIAFEDLSDLMAQGLREGLLQSCALQQMFRYALGVDDASQHAGSIDLATSALSSEEGVVRDIVRALVTTPSFRFRKKGSSNGV